MLCQVVDMGQMLHDLVSNGRRCERVNGEVTRKKEGDAHTGTQLLRGAEATGFFRQIVDDGRTKIVECVCEPQQLEFQIALNA